MSMNYTKAVAAALVCLALGSCHSGSEGEYVNTSKGFRIVFPTNWEIQEQTMSLDVGAFSAREGSLDKFRDNVTVASTELTAPLTSEQVLDTNLPTMLSILTDFQPEGRGVEDIGGVKSAWLVYTHRQGQYRLRVKLYALAGKERAYLIYCTAETDAYGRFEKRFDEIVKSFEAQK